VSASRNLPMLSELPEAITAEIAKLKAIIAEQRERLRPDMRELLLFEAAESGFKLELDLLREFFAAATDHGVMLTATHTPMCPFDSNHACGCGRFERQARLDKAIAEASEDDAGETMNVELASLDTAMAQIDAGNRQLPRKT
jgi:hypothetical protein